MVAVSGQTRNVTIGQPHLARTVPLEHHVLFDWAVLSAREEVTDLVHGDDRDRGLPIDRARVDPNVRVQTVAHGAALKRLNSINTEFARAVRVNRERHGTTGAESPLLQGSDDHRFLLGREPVEARVCMRIARPIRQLAAPQNENRKQHQKRVPHHTKNVA